MVSATALMCSGKTITLNGVDSTIVGVAPPGFRLSGNVGFRLEGETEVYTPRSVRPIHSSLVDCSAHSGIFAFARLEPGVNSDLRAKRR